MDVELLYLPECPNLERVRGRLREAVQVAGVGATIRETEVSTREAAARVGMRGSPTILINGRDPFAAREVKASLSCRLYVMDGSIDGAPSVNELIIALQGDDPT